MIYLFLAWASVNLSLQVDCNHCIEHILCTAPHEKLAKIFSKQKNELQSVFLEASFLLKVFLSASHYIFLAWPLSDCCFISIPVFSVLQN